jgi:hypothetical protein
MRKVCRQCGNEFGARFNFVMLCPDCNAEKRRQQMDERIPDLIATVEHWRRRALEAERELARLRAD